MNHSELVLNALFNNILPFRKEKNPFKGLDRDSISFFFTLWKLHFQFSKNTQAKEKQEIVSAVRCVAE